MRKLNGFKLLCVLAIFGGTANADIIIDNQSIPAADISAISISPASGNLFVSTIPGYTVSKVVVGNDVAITSFTISPGTITAGGSTTLSWSSANADSCAASNGVGGWSGLPIGTSGSTSITTSTIGTHQFTLTCSGPVGLPATSNVTLVVNAPGSVSITSFTASPANIDAGASTTLSWTTQNASSCTASGGTGGWSGSVIGLPNGSKAITIDTEGTYAFTLTCADVSGGSDVVSAVVTANPASACATPALAGEEILWIDFWLVNFPAPTYGSRYATVPRYGYFAVKFNTGDVFSNGKISTIETTITDGVRLGAISECPGIFDVEPACDYVWGIGGNISWSTTGKVGACQLQPNTDYYFNLTFTDGSNASTSSCNRSPCVTNVQHLNF